MNDGILGEVLRTLWLFAGNAEGDECDAQGVQESASWDSPGQYGRRVHQVLRPQRPEQ